MPQSGLDMNMLLTDTVWGSQQISAQIREKIQHRHENLKLINQIGKNVLSPEVEKIASWELLSFYTRDMRLANLNVLTGEVVYCQHYIDLAGDLLREGYIESFATALARAATVLELSQSKGGFLRRRHNTLTQENLHGDIDHQKKKLISFGGSKNGG